MMTNEEKALCLAEKHCKNYATPDVLEEDMDKYNSFPECKKSALEMAEYKDKKVEKYLKSRIEKYTRMYHDGSFYMIWVEGKSSPSKTYLLDQIEEVRKEADRLALHEGRKTYILKATEMITPVTKHQEL